MFGTYVSIQTDWAAKYVHYTTDKMADSDEVTASGNKAALEWGGDGWKWWIAHSDKKEAIRREVRQDKEGDADIRWQIRETVSTVSVRFMTVACFWL